MSKAVVPSWVEPASLVGLVPAGLGLPGAALVQTEVVPLWVHQLWTSQPPDHNQPIIITHGEADMLHCIALHLAIPQKVLPEVGQKCAQA